MTLHKKVSREQGKKKKKEEHAGRDTIKAEDSH